MRAVISKIILPVKIVIVRGIRFVAPQVMSRPLLRKAAMSVVSLSPAVSRRLRNIVLADPANSAFGSRSNMLANSQLSPRARLNRALFDRLLAKDKK
ncbi:hypothetical protein [Maritalea porphyrae]|uniref:hypothetical protein n=1 Tax=Maritalea porphyrae TaxID=880732 RepID=UPI0022AFFFB9|nr:hypothetical protein [Maritalea porphyrae]MCZ4271952.1 hypothetical protein [Maritalea porphyrae]